MSAITPLDKDTVLARARAAIDTRTRYVESLFDAATAASTAHSAAAAARTAAADADTALAKAYKDAVDAGWTPAELKSAGLPTPAAPRTTSRRATGPRTRTAAKKPSTATESNNTTEPRTTGSAEANPSRPRPQ